MFSKKVPVKKFTPSNISDSPPPYCYLENRVILPPRFGFFWNSWRGLKTFSEEDQRHFIQVTCGISEFGFRSGKLDSNWNKLNYIITKCTWWKLVDLQIIVMKWAHVSYQIRRYTQKEFIIPHTFFAIGNKE